MSVIGVLDVERELEIPGLGGKATGKPVHGSRFAKQIGPERENARAERETESEL